MLEVDVTELKLAVSSSLLEVTHIKQSISGMDERSYAYHSFVQFSTFSFLPLYRNGAREMHTMTERNTQIRAYHFALAVRRFSRSLANLQRMNHADSGGVICTIGGA